MGLDTCSQSGCDKSLFMNNLCHLHAYEAKTHEPPIKKTCTVNGCILAYYAKGYCIKHYNYNRIHGHPCNKGNTVKSPCTESDCSVASYLKGLCQYHYHSKRYARKKKEDALRVMENRCTPVLHRNKYVNSEGKPQLCSIKHCPSVVAYRGYCKDHYREVDKYGKIK